MKGSFWIGVSVVLFAGGAWGAQTVKSGADQRKDVLITVYNRDLGLVRERRMLRLPQGDVALEFEDVAARIDPTSVSFQSGGVGVLEQNYEFDLLSPQKLMDKYVGQDLELRWTETLENRSVERTAKAKLIANNNGPLYLIDKHIHVGHPGRVVLPDLPASLRARPTLVYLLDVESEGEREADVSYQTAGMNWNCDYVAVIDKSDKYMTLLTGWVTLENRSGATYENAALKLVAGDVHRAPGARRQSDDRVVLKMARAEAAFEEQAFFEYHLYTLSRRTTLRDNSSKQVELFSASDVPVKKILTVEPPRDYYGWWNAARSDVEKVKVGVALEFKNDAASNLGMPLPQGKIRVNKEDDDGNLIFVGEDRIDHTPKDETVKIQVGNAFDVVAERKQTEFRIVNDSPRVVESSFEIEIRNRKSEPVDVRVVEMFPPSQEIKILKNSQPYKKITAQRYEFIVTVYAGATEKLTYQARIEY